MGNTLPVSVFLNVFEPTGNTVLAFLCETLRFWPQGQHCPSLSACETLDNPFWLWKVWAFVIDAKSILRILQLMIRNFSFKCLPVKHNVPEPFQLQNYFRKDFALLLVKEKVKGFSTQSCEHRCPHFVWIRFSQLIPLQNAFFKVVTLWAIVRVSKTSQLESCWCDCFATKERGMPCHEWQKADLSQGFRSCILRTTLTQMTPAVTNERERVCEARPQPTKSLQLLGCWKVLI